MKHLIASTALLVVVLAASDADAGIMYGHRVANRLSTGTSGFTRFYRYLGRLEYRKDMWLLGRPIGEAPPDYCPGCGQPMTNHGGNYYYESNDVQPSQPQPTPAKPTPAKEGKQPTPTVLAAPPAVQR